MITKEQYLNRPNDRTLGNKWWDEMRRAQRERTWPMYVHNYWCANIIGQESQLGYANTNLWTTFLGSSAMGGR